MGIFNITNWLSGGGGAILGALVGGVVTAHYNSRESEKRFRKELQFKILDEITNEISENKSKLNSFSFFVRTRINTLSASDFSTSFLQDDNIITFTDNLQRVIYESTKSCNKLVWSIQKRQMVLLKNKKIVSDIYSSTKNIVNVMKELSDLLIEDYTNKMNKGEEKCIGINEVVNKFERLKNKHYKILYSLDIELENEIYGDIFNKRMKNPLLKGDNYNQEKS